MLGDRRGNRVEQLRQARLRGREEVVSCEAVGRAGERASGRPVRGNSEQASECQARRTEFLEVDPTSDLPALLDELLDTAQPAKPPLPRILLDTLDALARP